MLDILLANAPSICSFENDSNSSIGGIEEVRTERRDSPLVELRRLDKFRLGIGVVNQSHPMARRAARMTCS